METLKVTKVYGLRPVNKGWAICTDVKLSKGQDGILRMYYHTSELAYKKYSFAMEKANEFMKSLYKDFVNFQGNKVEFGFINLEILPEAGKPITEVPAKMAF